MATGSNAVPKRKGSLRNRPAKPLSPKASADVSSLETRRALRNVLDLDSVSLLINWESKNGEPFVRDLTEQCDAFPHHRTLILQLRLGCEIRVQARPISDAKH